MINITAHFVGPTNYIPRVFDGEEWVSPSAETTDAESVLEGRVTLELEFSKRGYPTVVRYLNLSVEEAGNPEGLRSLLEKFDANLQLQLAKPPTLDHLQEFSVG